jgi:hypothetical protein
MKMKTLAAFIGLLAHPALAAAQERNALWADLGESRPFPALQDERDYRGRGGQVTEEWVTPRLHSSLSFYGRASFPSDTDVTVDHLTYSDFFDVGLGLSVEGDLLQYVTPHWGMGGYLSVGWDRFSGQSLSFSNGDVANVGDMDLTTFIVGGKLVQHVNPFLTWEGRMGVGIVHYRSVHWSGTDLGIPFTNDELFRAITRGVFEIGGRIGFGNPRIEGDFGFGVRIMGGAARGKDVTNAIDPEILTTFMLELGLTLHF